MPTPVLFPAEILPSVLQLLLPMALPRTPDLAAQRAAMQKLSFLAGKWSGEARLRRGPTETVELLQTEEAQYKLDGLILVIEGVGRTKSYDPWGNRTDQTVTAGTCNPFHATANTQNQLIDPLHNAYTYDSAGNMTADGSHTYFYDAENRLSQVDGSANYCSSHTGTPATACYVYDALGRRAEKNVGGHPTDYLYDAWGNVSNELNNVCAPVCIDTDYLYLDGQLVAEYKEGLTYFVYRDHLGSTRLVTDYPWVSQSQSIAQNLDYLPFGELNSTDSGISTHKFTGKERDSETGFEYFGARFDSSSMGRFMSPDPSMDSVRLRNPQSWNRYAYTINNPLRYIDPDGELWVASGNSNDPYLWVDKCGEKQTCYDSIGAVVGNSLRLYGSNNAQDITNIQGNSNGMVDLNDINQQHDAAFDVNTRTDYSYVSLQTGADFFNFVQDYQSNYPDAPNLYVTEAGSENGADVPGHLTHHGGKQIDLRYVDDNGNPIRDPEAYNQADADRMWDIFRMAHNAGMTQIYAGDDSQWGDYAHRPTNPNADPHFSHFHLSIPNPPNPTPPRH